MERLTTRFLMAVIAMIFSLQGIAKAAGPGKQQQDPPKIAFLMDALYTDRWYKDRDYFKQFAREKGAEVMVKVANSKADKQLQQAKEAIEAGADLLVVVPTHKTKARKIIQLAHENGIQVLAYDRLIQDDALDYYISFDTEKVGKIQADFALSRVPTGKYALIFGPGRDYNSLLHRRGVMKVLKPRIRNNRIDIVYQEHQDEWAEMEAYMSMDALLGKHPDIDAIIAANDMFAIGANMALMANGMAGNILITGQDATAEGVQMLIDGSLSMTVYKPIKNLARKAAEVAVKLANNQSIPAPDVLEINGLSVDCWLLDVVKVTPGNIEETVIQDGHLKRSDLSFD